jgi:hypothetical protein
VEAANAIAPRLVGGRVDGRCARVHRFREGRWAKPVGNAARTLASIGHDLGMAAPGEGAKDDLTRELLWRAADRASNWALQGQATVQARFGNFLLADSFLLLSWATVYAGGTKTTSRTAVLAVLAMTSVFLAAVFALLGRRYAQYDRLQWDLADEAEARLPPDLRLVDRVHALRQNKAAEGPTGRRYELSAAERLVSTSKLLIWAPAVLCVTSLILLTMSFLPR